MRLLHFKPLKILETWCLKRCFLALPWPPSKTVRNLGVSFWQRYVLPLSASTACHKQFSFLCHTLWVPSSLLLFNPQLVMEDGWLSLILVLWLLKLYFFLHCCQVPPHRGLSDFCGSLSNIVESLPYHIKPLASTVFVAWPCVNKTSFN